MQKNGIDTSDENTPVNLGDPKRNKYEKDGLRGERMRCKKGKKNDKIRRAIQSIIDNGGSDLMPVNELATFVEQRVHPKTGSFSIGCHQLGSILREFKRERVYKYGFYGNSVTWVRILGKQHYPKRKN